MASTIPPIGPYAAASSNQLRTSMTAIFLKGKKGEEVPTRSCFNARSTGIKGLGLSISTDDDGKDKPDQGVALKLSWGEMSGTREKVIVDTARKVFVGKEFSEGGDPCDYLPEILGEKVFADFDTDIGMAFLETYKGNRAKRPLAKRYPVLVLTPEYKPISSITSLPVAGGVSLFIALIYCHAILWSVGIEHGDISEGNLMVEESTGWPKLCDYDLSNFRGAKPSGYFNAGTWVFMASELLTLDAMDGKVARLYRHDSESFITVLVWVFLRYNNGKLVPNSLLEEWVQDAFWACRDFRERTYSAIRDSHLARPDWLPNDMWNAINDLLTDFYELFTSRQAAFAQMKGLVKRKEEKPQNPTLGAVNPETPFLSLLSRKGEIVATAMWTEKDEEQLTTLKKVVEEYDDLRFTNKAISKMALFKFPMSLGTHFTKLLKDHLNVENVTTQ